MSAHISTSIGDGQFDNTRKGRKRKFLDQNSTDHNEKRKIHRETERQRRQEMATLFKSLGSVLPLEFIKGKRSAQEHISGAVAYINHLKKEIKELETKRDELRKLLNLRNRTFESENRKYSNSYFTIIRPSCGGIQIVMRSSYGEDGLPLSRVLKVLLEEGLCVVSCISSKINPNFIVHTIQSEVCQFSCMDQIELEQRLAGVNPLLRHMIAEELQRTNF